MYNLIVCNFDKALVDSNGVIPTSTVLLFDELRHNNIKIVFITKECFKSVFDYNRDFIFCDYLVASSGSYIYDVVHNKTIYKNNIGIRTVKRIIKDYIDKATIYIVSTVWNLIAGEELYHKYDVIKILDNNKFFEDNKNNIYKIELYFKKQNEAKACLKKLKELSLNININFQKEQESYIIEIVNLNTSKLEGMNKILEKEKLVMRDVIFFGSDLSDIDLLKKVGLGVAMENSVDKVKKVAKEVTLCNNSKGIEQYLRKIF